MGKGERIHLLSGAPLVETLCCGLNTIADGSGRINGYDPAAADRITEIPQSGRCEGSNICCQSIAFGGSGRTRYIIDDNVIVGSQGSYGNRHIHHRSSGKWIGYVGDREIASFVNSSVTADFTINSQGRDVGAV